MVPAVAGLRRQFFAERLSETAKSIKITLFAEPLTVISPIYVHSKCSVKIVNKNIKTHYIFNKNATLTPCSCNFYDFVSDLRKFSTDFWRLKSRIRDFSLLACMVIVFGCGGVSPSYGDNSYPGFSLCYGVSLMVLVLYHNTSLRFGVSLCYTVCLCYCDVMPYV